MAGIDVADGERKFHQNIQCGYALNINNGAIQLSVSDYAVTAANDVPRAPIAVDFFRVDFSTLSDPSTTSSILVNGTPWTGSVGFISIELSWPWDTFVSPDEPKLTADRPATANAGVFAFVGSAVNGTGAPARVFSSPSFSISPIAHLAGDYNRNGMHDGGDYVEWRQAFQGTDAALHYADGNNDGIVDSADYVVWRKAMAVVSSLDIANSNVPEPNAFVSVLVSLFFFVRRTRNTIVCRDSA